jgi:energy-coupling factor transporter ATP-binding protein EcfA2
MKSDLEDDMSALAMQPDAFGEYATDDRQLHEESRRKGAKSVNRRTNKPVEKSWDTKRLGSLLTTASFSFSFAVPPQPDYNRAASLAGYQMAALFYWITYNAQSKRGGFWPGEGVVTNVAFRRDWGNSLQRSFAAHTRDWDQRLQIVTADGYFKASSDSVGRGLACSITATYHKISSDAEKIVKDFAGQIQSLIFMTSGKVSNEKKIEWTRKIRATLDIDLLVISREDIIASLMDPTNAGLCRSFLSIDVDIASALRDTIATIRDAARDEAKNWARRLKGLPMIPLQGESIGSKGLYTDSAWRLKDFETALREGQRIVVEAPAGRGKTTTLIQLANGALTDHGSVFLVDLQSWASSGRGILTFIAGMPSFERRGITSQQLAQAEAAERFYFLLNGWNEVTEALSNAAFLAMKDLERQFPSAGIAVATRAHYVSPPLPGATTIRLRRVSRRARREYVRERLGADARELLAAVETDRAVDQLTRTPFVLAEITSIVVAGEDIPRNRVAIMDSVISLHEKSIDHEQHLQATPLQGMANEYLAAIAVQMTTNGGTTLSANDARAAVSKTSSELIRNGQTATKSSPVEIINALCAHHVLERVEYPTTTYRFEHQLYQEYYSSRGLLQTFEAAHNSRIGSDLWTGFVEQFVNDPVWADALDMLMERVAAGNDRSSKIAIAPMASTLLQMALQVDLNFAAELANTVSLPPNSPVAADLEARLRAEYKSKDEHHRNFAIAGMLASGLSTFRDIVEPLLAAGDRQVRLRTNRLRSGLDVSILGENWPEVVSAWDDTARADLVSEILYHRFDPRVSDFALRDPSPTVRFAALRGLNWIGADEEFVQGVTQLTAGEFARLVLELPANSLPPDVYPRARRDLKAYLLDVTETLARLRVLLRLYEFAEASVVDNLKAELNRVELVELPVIESADELLDSVLDAIRKTDSDWVSEWVAVRIARGELWRQRWLPYVTEVAPDLAEANFEELSTTVVEHRWVEAKVEVVMRGDATDFARRSFLRLVEIDRLLSSSAAQTSELDREVYRQMEHLLRAFDPNAVLTAISDLLSSEPEIGFVARLSELYGYAGRMGGTGVSLHLNETSRQALRDYLLRSQEIVLGDADPDGSLKSAYASLVSQVGTPADIPVILAMVEADLRRLRIGREARRRGEGSETAKFVATSWASWYLRSIVALLSESADQFLVQLLNEPEYEYAVIEQVGRQFGLPMMTWGRNQSFESIWAARATPPKTDARRVEISNAIANLIKRLEESRPSQADPQHLNFRLKRLALGLSQSAPHNFKNLILTTLSLPGRYDASITVDALHQLIFAGVHLSADECITLLDQSIQEMRKMGIRDQEQFLIKRFLALCVYVLPQSAGLDKIRQLGPIAHFSIYDFRDLLPALAHSRFDGAVQLMQEIVKTADNWNAIEYDWVEALAKLETPAAQQIALSFADPDVPGPKYQLDAHAREKIADKIANLAREEPQVEARLRELSSLSLHEQQRELVALVLVKIATEESVRASINLIDDDAHPRTPWGVKKFLERTFVERRPYGDGDGVFTLHAAAANDLREALYGLVFNDARRKRAAYSLLGQIEEWRVEYGRPIDEPRHPAISSGLPWPPPEPE